MQTGQPSLTALGAARLRAAHQVLDNASILVDPLALRILGDDIEISLDHARAHASGSRLRWFIAARSRIAEDALNTAVEAGATQLVVLGAGLDTLAYRTPLAHRLRIFEVDHPATQASKRKMLATAAIMVPESLAYVAVDFERERLPEKLEAAGFDADKRSLFSWLGVVPYLTEPAIFSTLGYLAQLQGGAEVVFDYVNPAASIAPAGRAAHQALAERVAAIGERIQSYFDTAPLCERMRATGFRQIRDIGPAELADRFFPDAEQSAPRGGHIMHASTL
ncbi:class I SAM-dependent methyltransferase [Bradyrhizobium australiense]|uniref:S-adenosyl-L-methionine-dependent methyltransferase n=1 Tax=Bradyrhizobium australiense TaxID=2721161 RepID=A0A7Y4GVB3_9BRAD|nr:SAM-dependent methyltransferase [Bradyrhizobium australiense]NOJ42364.1 class I SAM-dependent methyltransferase [Bradyrhizobium australiense]